MQKNLCKYKRYCQAENCKNLSHHCSLILSFHVVIQILANHTGAKIHRDILTSEISDISFLTEEDILIVILVGMYLGSFTDNCIIRNPLPAVLINSNAYHL